MPIVRVPLGKGSEATSAPDGEYELVVRKFEQKDSGAGNPMWVATLGFTEESTYELFRHFFNMVLPSDDANRVAMKMRELKRFLHLFDVPYEIEEDGSATFDTDDVPGAKATCRVSVASIDTKTGARDVNRLMLPRVQDE